METETRNEGRRLLVSGYNLTPDEAAIFTYDVNALGKATPLGSASGVISPSFCAVGNRGLYAASESATYGGAAFYRLESDGAPTLQNAMSFGSAAGSCFILPDPERPAVYAANYDSGSVSCYAVDDEGQLAGMTELVQHEGHGPVRLAGDPHFGRQQHPHVHSLSFVPGTQLLAAVDLGLDLIALYAVDAQGRIVDAPGQTALCPWGSGGSSFHEIAATSDGHHVLKLERWCDCSKTPAFSPSVAEAILPARPAAIIEAPLGSGPRLVAYHPTRPIAALVCELSCEVILFRLSDDGLRWTAFERRSLLEGDAEADDEVTPLSAHVAFSPDGRFLYASTRGINRMTIFTLSKDGNAIGRSDIPCGGKTPRHFALSPDGAFLAVANRTSDNVALFVRDAATGSLRQTDSLPCPSPSCIVWL